LDFFRERFLVARVINPVSARNRVFFSVRKTRFPGQSFMPLCGTLNDENNVGHLGYPGGVLVAGSQAVFQ